MWWEKSFKRFNAQIISNNNRKRMAKFASYFAKTYIYNVFSNFVPYLAAGFCPHLVGKTR